MSNITTPYHVDPLNCTGNSTVCPVSESIYGYAPNLPSTIFFVALFALCGLVNLVLGIRYKTWSYAFALCLGSICMTLGYIGRVMLHYNAFSAIGFQIQICCLTIAPAFNSAAIYLILKHLVRTFGREFSRIRPKYYTWIFITADICALILQGAGGGIAATANTNSSRDVGDNLMITGIVWQVATLVLFGVAALDFLVRRYKAVQYVPLSFEAQKILADKKFRAFLVGYVTAFVTILVRCVYRIAEMAGGWQNSIMQTEILFIVLESVMLSIAFTCQTVFHPGFCFPAMSAPNMKKTTSIAEKEIGASSSDEEIVRAPAHEEV